jgi:hypothetical protein
MKNSSAAAAKAALLFAFSAVSILPSRAQAPTADSSRKPVLVELFTAEGCSSCPPADNMAMKMEKQLIPGAEVIVLEEHVDYWNQYGWIDPFSSREWTARQQWYVSKLAHGDAYTPEMVVDGESQFNGSNGREAQAAIEKAMRGLETAVSVTDTTVDPRGDDEFKISVGKLEGNADGDTAEVWIAVTEDGLHSNVSAGENSGRTLYHAAVLRYLHKVGEAHTSGGATSFTGDAHVKIKSSWKAQNIHIVAFVQEKKSLKVLGAASTKLTS